MDWFLFRDCLAVIGAVASLSVSLPGAWKFAPDAPGGVSCAEPESRLGAGAAESRVFLGLGAASSRSIAA
jgi:hypothetical protein